MRPVHRRPGGLTLLLLILRDVEVTRRVGSGPTARSAAMGVARLRRIGGRWGQRRLIEGPLEVGDVYDETIAGNVNVFEITQARHVADREQDEHVGGRVVIG